MDLYDAAIIARDAGLRSLLGTATRAYLAGDSTALDPAWYDAGFAVLIDEGGLPEAKLLAQRALASQDPLLRPAVLDALTGSDSAAVAKWVLDDFTDAKLRKSERLNLIRSVISNRSSRDLGFDWLKAHIDKLTAGGSGIFFTARLPGIVAGFCSAARADEVAALLTPKLAGKTGALELARTLERIRDCAVLKDQRGAELSAALAQAK